MQTANCDRFAAAQLCPPPRWASCSSRVTRKWLWLPRDPMWTGSPTAAVRWRAAKSREDQNRDKPPTTLLRQAGAL